MIYTKISHGSGVTAAVTYCASANFYWCGCRGVAGVGDKYLILEEAARVSGLHTNTIQRLLQSGVLTGYKAVVRGRMRWLVSARSLRYYCDPINGFLLDLRGPKLYLRRFTDSQDDP
jgi:hypothetical protein